METSYKLLESVSFCRFVCRSKELGVSDRAALILDTFALAKIGRIDMAEVCWLGLYKEPFDPCRGRAWKCLSLFSVASRRANRRAGDSST